MGGGLNDRYCEVVCDYNRLQHELRALRDEMDVEVCKTSCDLQPLWKKHHKMSDELDKKLSELMTLEKLLGKEFAIGKEEIINNLQNNDDDYPDNYFGRLFIKTNQVWNKPPFFFQANKSLSPLLLFLRRPKRKNVAKV